MFDVPLDSWYVWFGLAVVSSATVGVVGTLPSSPPPDAAGGAQTIDSVAASDRPAVGKHPLSNAESVRIGTSSLSLRGAGGVSHESLRYGPATPAGADDRLQAVLRGSHPSKEFDTPAAFAEAAAAARTDQPYWHTTDELVVRRVIWEGTDVVLAG